MDTLFEKVKKVEEEAQMRVTQIENKAKDSLSDMIAAETALIDKIRTSAEKRADSIVSEKISVAKNELSALHDDEKTAVKSVQKQAEQNRGSSLEKALQLFERDYLEA